MSFTESFFKDSLMIRYNIHVYCTVCPVFHYSFIMANVSRVVLLTNLTTFIFSDSDNLTL